MELNTINEIEEEEEEEIVEIPIDVLNELKSPITLDTESPNIIILERPEEPKKENVDTADIRNYYINKSKVYFSDVLKYLFKKKFIIILGLIISIVLIVMYYFFDSWRYMGWKAWFSIVVTMASVLILIGNMLPPAFVFLGATTLCYIFGIISTSEALDGFSNSGVVSVGVLFIVAKTIEMSDILKYVVKYVLRHPKSLAVAQIRLLFPVAFLSGFINNTPIVALMIPVVQSWSTQCGFSVSKLLLPLSYAAIIGGTCTLIGTSTNLIVAGLVQNQFPNFQLGFFEIAIVGIPVAILSLIYMFTTSKFLLPDNKIKRSTPEAVENDGNEATPGHLREYSVSMIITKKSTLVGKTVESKGLHTLQGLKLFKILRHNKETKEETEIVPVDPSTILEPGDILFFQGLLDDISVLYQLDGLVPATTQISKVKGKRADRVLVEVVLAAHSPHVGITIRETHFRSLYNAVILAVHRQGVNLAQKIRDIQLEVGDTLLLETTKDFLKYHQNDSNFALVSEISRGETTAPRPITFSTVFVLFLGFAMVVVSALQLMDLLPVALAVACIYILFGRITWRQALSCIQGDTLLTIAAAFGLGNALQASGAASVISNTLVTIFSTGGRIGVLAGLYFTTAILSAVISNGATVTLMFPIAIGFAYTTGISIKCITYTLMMAASCCFITPVGYQTNLMVMGPGGYKTIDFIKFGLPLTIIDMITTVTIVYLVWVDDYLPQYYSYYTTLNN